MTYQLLKGRQYLFCTHCQNKEFDITRLRCRDCNQLLKRNPKQNRTRRNFSRVE